MESHDLETSRARGEGMLQRGVREERGPMQLDIYLVLISQSTLS